MNKKNGTFQRQKGFTLVEFRKSFITKGTSNLQAQPLLNSKDCQKAIPLELMCETLPTIGL